MADSIASPASGEAATPAAPVSGEQVTSGTGAAPQEGTASAETPAGERPSRAQERIEELNSRYKAAVEYGDFFRQRFQEAVQTSQKPPVEPAPVEQPEPEPQADAFDDPKEYAKAIAVWARKEAARDLKVETARITKESQGASERAIEKAREEERLRGLDVRWQARAAEFAQKNPDFWPLAQNPALTFLHGAFLAEVKDSELGPQLVHHISQSPKIVAQLASQSVEQRLKTLGRLEAELSRPAPPPKVTTAPAPPSPVGGSQGAVNSEPKDVKDWMAWRNSQDPRLKNLSRR